MSCEDSISYEQLVEGLLELFDGEKENVVIEEVQAFVNRLVKQILITQRQGSVLIQISGTSLTSRIFKSSSNGINTSTPGTWCMRETLSLT